jgi:hypothetical protein
MWQMVKNFFQNLCETPEQAYLSQSVDLADFERRQRMLQMPERDQMLHKHWY